VSRVLRFARHIIGHFGDESCQAITCTGADNTKQTGKIHTQKTENKQTGQVGLSKTHKTHTENP